MKCKENYWTYKASPIPEFHDLPKGTFSGTKDEWESLTPGFRREIYRASLKRKEI